MSKKRKANSRRPKGFLGKPSPQEQTKRLVVCLFGLFFIGITAWSCVKTDLTSLFWWHFVVIASMFLLGGYLVFIALLPRQSQVNSANDQLIENTARSIFRAILDKLF